MSSASNSLVPILGIVGPSGVGKSSVVQKLAALGLVRVNPTWTTRPPRTGEAKSTVEHHFVSNAAFDRKAAAGDFLEVVELFGLPFRYAVPPLAISLPSRPSLLMLRANLMPLLQKHYPNHIIYQIESPLEIAAVRLREREKAGEPIGRRLLDYRAELDAGRKCANRIFINDTIDDTVEALRAAIAEDFSQ